MSKETKQIEKTVIDSNPVFAKDNYKIMIAGLVITVIGFLLMMGGYTDDPNHFKPEEVYSFRRITVAHTVIVLGLLVEIYAIMRRPKKS
jgi:fumarate reductase subunit D